MKYSVAGQGPVQCRRAVQGGGREDRHLEENAGAAEIDLTEDEFVFLEPIAGQVRGSGAPERSDEMLALLESES